MTDTINVVRVKGDGSCIYASIMHQINGVEVGSKVHIDQTRKIRKDVVHHIKNNLAQFSHLIDDRLDTNALKKIDRITYLNDHLSQDSTWGGPESLIAISEIYMVNIIIFSEEDSYYFFPDFNSSYKGSILLAFRKGVTRWNHYDSIVELKQPLIQQVAQCLSKR